MKFKNIDIHEWILDNGLHDAFINDLFLSDILEKFLIDQINYNKSLNEKHECGNHRVESKSIDFCGKCGKSII